MVNFKTYEIIDWTSIATYILPIISRSKGNQAVKFGQLIKYSVRKIFLLKPCRKWGRKTSSRPIFGVLKKLCLRLKQVVSTLVLIYFGRPHIGHK